MGEHTYFDAAQIVAAVVMMVGLDKEMDALDLAESEPKTDGLSTIRALSTVH